MSSTGNLSSVASYMGKQTALEKFLQFECKSGRIDANQAAFFFGHMLNMNPRLPISSFSTLLGGLVKSNHSSLAISFYKTLDISGVLGPRSDRIILNILINCYSKMKLERAAFSVLGLTLKYGYHPDIIAFSSLIKGLFSEKKAVDAVELYSKMGRMGCTPNVVTYNVLIDGLCKNGKAATALQLHREMVPGKNIMRNAKLIGARIYPNVISYNCLIDGLCRSEMEDDAVCLFSEMIYRGVHPNPVTYSIIINQLSKKGKIKQAMFILETMELQGKSSDTVTYNTILDGYCRIGKINEAMNLYKDMNCKGIIRSNATFNLLLKGLFRVKRSEDARGLFNEMKRTDASGYCSQITYATMIDGLCKEGDVDAAKKLFLEMAASNVSPKIHVYNSMIDGLCKQGHIDEACGVFRFMERCGCKCDVVTFTTLIQGYCEAEMVKEAYDLFLEMEGKGCFPNLVTFDILIGAFAREKEFAKVKELLEKMHAMKIPLNMNLKCMVLECLKEMDDEDGRNWINSIPDLSSLNKQDA